MRTIRDANDCVRRPMLCWVDYPSQDAICYAYPWYVVDDGVLCKVAKDAFPTEGGMAVVLTGGHHIEAIQDENGELVVVTVNADEMPEDGYYGTKRGDKNQYRGMLNPSFQRGHSEVEFERLSKNALSSSLIQVVQVEEREDFQRPIGDALTLVGDVPPQTNLVMIASTDGTILNGPFAYDLREGGTISIKATPEFDNRVASVHRNEFDYCPVRNRYREHVAAFITLDSLYDRRASMSDEDLYDWITDEELVEVANRAINSAKDAAGLTKSTMRTLKNAIRNCTGETARITLDEARRRRLEKLFDDFEFWRDSPDAVDRFASSFTAERLSEIILDEAIYPRFKDRVIAEAALQDDVAAERKQLQGRLEELRADIATAESELEDAQRRTDEARSQYDRLKDEAIAERREELEGIEVEISQKHDEVAQVRSQWEYLVKERDRAQQAVDEVFAGIGDIDDVEISKSLLDSEILRRVVSMVTGQGTATTSQEATAPNIVFSTHTEALSGKELADELYRRISEEAGRSYSKNDVVNFLICMSQGYITTFAGKPGTGKTSLCNILAGILGLTYPDQAKRFAELPVEKGWASYRDFIGYFNPLTKQYEKTLPLAYDSLMTLSKESGTEGPHAPFLFLLDEANLSPIEHYWAPFLHACDTFRDGMDLTLGGNNTWRIPAWVRFLATVNFDHTTEALSPRFLDRSWVITLGYDDIDLDTSFTRSDLTVHAPIPYERLMEVFGGKDDYVPDPTISSAMGSIFRSCHEAGYPISPRSQSMIARYVSAAVDLMETSSKESQMAPLDYAVSQKILPMLSGPSEQMEKVVKALGVSCASLTRTSEKLKQMHDMGEANGFYQYFA